MKIKNFGVISSVLVIPVILSMWIGDLRSLIWILVIQILLFAQIEVDKK